MTFDLEVFDSSNTSYIKQLVKHNYQSAKDYARNLSLSKLFKIVIHNPINGSWVQYEQGEMTEWSQVQ